MSDDQQFQHHRIDKGIKRGPRKRLIPKPHEIESAAREKARSERGTFITKYTPETRQNAIKDALESLARGETVLDVATRHNVARSTLETWLIADGSAHEARSLFYAGQIADCMEEMRTADNPLSLARARDMRRAWAETAAVRDRNFMQKQEVKMDVSHSVQVDQALTDSARLLVDKARGVDAAAHIPQRIIDVTPEEPNNQ